MTVIEIAGEVTRESDLHLQDAYERAGTDTRAIILSFDGLEYMNSSGIGLLVWGWRDEPRAGDTIGRSCGLDGMPGLCGAQVPFPLSSRVQHCARQAGSISKGVRSRFEGSSSGRVHPFEGSAKSYRFEAIYPRAAVPLRRLGEQHCGRREAGDIGVAGDSPSRQCPPDLTDATTNST